MFFGCPYFWDRIKANPDNKIFLEFTTFFQLCILLTIGGQKFVNRLFVNNEANFSIY